MDLNFKTVEGSQAEKPSEIDTTSSDTTVYIRRNIHRITKVDELTGEKVELWQYDEAQTNKDGAIEYLANLLQNTQEAVDFLLMGGA